MFDLDPSFQKSFQHAVSLLKEGTPVAIPTETVYGLAAPINNVEAIKKIFSLKERPFFDPLIVHIASVESIKELSPYQSETLDRIIAAFWPGPLTIVLPKFDTINPMITSGLETVGIRFPSHPLAQKIIAAVGTPLAAPSANKFGKTSPTKSEHIRIAWPNGEVFALEGGSSEVGIESTVIQIIPSTETSIDATKSTIINADTSNNPNNENSTEKVLILRKGIITKEMLMEVAGPNIEISYAESSASPGHTPDHYMPDIPLVIVEDTTMPLSEVSLETIRNELSKESSMHDVLKTYERYGILELENDPLMAARNLYEKLHQLSRSAYDFAIVGRNHLLHQRDPIEGNSTSQNSHWSAIWDRLERAAKVDLTQ